MLLAVKRHCVSSSNVTAVGREPGDEDNKVHSEKHGTLEAEFGDGSIYRYEDVPESKFHGLRQARSVAVICTAISRGRTAALRSVSNARSMSANQAKWR
jgi:hypothetical protein